MKAKKSLVLFLISCLCLTPVFCLGAAAEDGAESSGMSTFALVSLIIGAVLLVTLIVLAIVKRKKLAESLRAYRSELKKITWYPWKSVWRGTVFVIVTVLITAAVIGILDVFFYGGQSMLTGDGIRLPW